MAERSRNADAADHQSKGVGRRGVLGIDGWNTFGRKPITRSEIRREMDRLSGAP